MSIRPRFYTLSQVARLLGVHYETVARWVRAGKFPAVKLSTRKVIIPKEKFDALVSGELPFQKKQEAPPIGSPKRWLKLAGTLTPKDAAMLRKLNEDLESVEEVD